MPNRSLRDQMQGTLRVFGQSLGLIDKDKDEESTAPPAPPPKTKQDDTSIQNAAQKMKGAPAAIDKAVDEAS